MGMVSTSMDISMEFRECDPFLMIHVSNYHAALG